MKTTKLALVSMLIAAAAAAPAKADTLDFYAGGIIGAGTSFQGDRAFGGLSYGAVLGIDIPVLRAEAEYNYLRGKRNGDSINAHVGMVNGYIKFLPTPVIKPYIGLGLGSTLGGGMADEDIKAAWAVQGMLGIQIDLTFIPVWVDLETRLLHAAKATPDDGLTQWDARMKLRYAF